jgi:death-on-curing protein
MKFLKKKRIVVRQAELIDRFGGSDGIRDEGALDSALMAAENRFYYENADLIACAATYAYHLSQAHAFIDGNKRIAAFAMEAFLRLNKKKVVATDEEIIEFFLAIASGDVSRDDVEIQIRAWIL